MKIMRLSLLVIFLTLLLSLPASATGPEAAFGNYSYSSKDLNLSFVWDAEGIHHFVINGKKLKVKYTGLEENLANFGSNGVWHFPITIEETPELDRYLNLILLINNDRLVKVSGLYHASTLGNKQSDGRKLLFSKTIEVRFRPRS
jgi:hypothetical protein